MQRSDEIELLKKYAETRSEAAFAEIVRRYLNLVYSAALRIAGGDACLAQDVAQMVFCDLVQRAAGNCSSLRGLGSLSGWLYRSACFTAAKAVRGERRRHVRHEKAQAMSEVHDHSPEKTDWNQLQPEIDAAMLELSDSDREAVLMRYFEDEKLAAIGNRLGISENAARMRVERALERLRTVLKRRGVTASASGLATALVQQGVLSAPAGLAASITAASTLSAAGAAFTATSTLEIIMASAKAKLTFAALAAALVATPIVIQHQRSSRLADELGLWRQEAQETPLLRAEVARLTREAQAIEEERSKERAELARLRGELAALKATSSKPAPPTKATNAAKPASPPRNAEDDLVRAEDWKNVGFATPSATVQTLEWAKARGDTNVIFNSLAWADETSRAGIEALFAAAPETVRARYGSADAYILSLFNDSGPLDARHTMTSFRVVTENISGDEAILEIEGNWADGSSFTHPMRYVRIGNDWRQALDFDAPSVGKLSTSLQAEGQREAAVAK